MKLNRSNGEAFAPICTTCDGSPVDSAVFAKMEGNSDHIAYDSYAKKNKNFLEERKTREALGEMERNNETDQDIQGEEQEGEDSPKVGKL